MMRSEDWAAILMVLGILFGLVLAVKGSDNEPDDDDFDGGCCGS